MDRDDRLARRVGSRPVSCCLIHVDGRPSLMRRGCGHGSDFLRIDTHSLAYAALNISPLFAGAFHAPPNGHGALLFSFAEIVNQTHGFPPPFGPSLVNQGHLVGCRRRKVGNCWISLFLSLRSKPLERLCPARGLVRLRLAAQRASRLPTPTREKRACRWPRFAAVIRLILSVASLQTALAALAWLLCQP
jgi:hypothetical protein